MLRALGHLVAGLAATGGAYLATVAVAGRWTEVADFGLVAALAEGLGGGMGIAGGGLLFAIFLRFALGVTWPSAWWGGLLLATLILAPIMYSTWTY